LGWGQVLVSMQLSNRSRCNRPTCIEEIEASMDMDISMDIRVKSVDMDMDWIDMNAEFHIHGKPVRR